MYVGGGTFSRYLRKRIIRIYPVMYIMITIAYVEQWIIRSMTGETWIAGSLDFLHLLYAFMGIEHWMDCSGPVILALWFIGPLMMCYILFYALTRWRGYRNLSWPVYVLPALAGAFLSGTDWAFAFLNQRMGRGLFGFFLGVLLCIAVEAIEKSKNAERLEQNICKIMLGTLIFMGMAYCLNRHLEKKFQITYNICGDRRLFLTLVFFPMFIFLSLKWMPLHKILQWKFLIYLGRISLSIYLLHEPLYFFIHIIQLATGLPADTASLSFFVIIAAILILLSALSWAFLEQPLQKYLDSKLQ